MAYQYNSVVIQQSPNNMRTDDSDGGIDSLGIISSFTQVLHKARTLREHCKAICIKETKK